MLSTSFLIFFFGILWILVMLLTARTMPKLVLTLIILFVGLFIFLLYLNAEFIGISFLIIYIGAIAILFIFTLMVVSTDEQLRQEISIPATASIFALMVHFAWTIVANLAYRLGFEALTVVYADGTTLKMDVDMLAIHINDLMLFGATIYTTHKWLFILSGTLLLIAIFGVIALTVPSRVTSFSSTGSKARKPWF